MEKISGTEVPVAFLEGGYTECRALDGAADLLRPFSVGYIKGYKRCVVLLILLQGIKELNLESDVPHNIRAAWFDRGFSYLNRSLFVPTIILNDDWLPTEFLATQWASH